MTETSPTALWNDSADPRELASAITWGATGATCNPVIALTALKADSDNWQRRIAEEADKYPKLTDSELGWAMVRELSVEAARQLEPAFEAHRGRNGRVSIQTDPSFHRNSQQLVAQALEFSELAPNMIVKIPATAAGITAIEEATYLGVSINATVSFTVSQAVAVAEAVEHGMIRREAEGLDTSMMGPVCTIMVGRTDDWIKVSAETARVSLDPGYCEWAGVAVFKKAYRIFQDRKYRTRLLSAAFRNHMHWSEFVGGDVVISPPFSWQNRLNASGMSPVARIDIPVDEKVTSALHGHIAAFRQAYDEDGLSTDEFDTYGATRRTLRQFLAANNELEAFVRDVVVPPPGC